MKTIKYKPLPILSLIFLAYSVRAQGGGPTDEIIKAMDDAAADWE
jgi:hypothetical protein